MDVCHCSGSRASVDPGLSLLLAVADRLDRKLKISGDCEAMGTVSSTMLEVTCHGFEELLRRLIRYEDVS